MTHPKKKEGAKQNDWDIEDLSFVAFSQYVFCLQSTTQGPGPRTQLGKRGHSKGQHPKVVCTGKIVTQSKI